MLQRLKASYPIAPAQVNEFKLRMLNWANRFSILCFLDSNNYSSRHSTYECLIATALESSRFIRADEHATDPLADLQHVHDSIQDWMFGHICYDFKNTLEPKLSSAYPVKLGFPLLGFFVPQTVCYINKQLDQLTIESFDDPAEIFAAICGSTQEKFKPVPALQFTSKIDKDSYLRHINTLRGHIAAGDCYEINFCNEACCNGADINPLQVFNLLNQLSPAPFAAYYRYFDQYMMCASPERYLRKEGNKVTAQPMKGTARRDADKEKDEAVKTGLRNNIKEQAENVMIVDLVRNDLARSCEPGSVMVDELFGIYSFPQVHQMVSTVSGQLKASIPFTDAIRYSFPMGSMTGAPKFKVMQLIEKYEQSRRELYSGTVGYISPAGDFDFNVIIRSLFYNAATNYLSYQTGGAITWDSDPEKEWEEMRLKAWAMERIFMD